MESKIRLIKTSPTESSSPIRSLIPEDHEPFKKFQNGRLLYIEKERFITPFSFRILSGTGIVKEILTILFVSSFVKQQAQHSI